jgi:hypothetical protein
LNFERLRRGEVIAGAGAFALLVFLFVPEWYALKRTFAPTAAILGVRTSWNGWWGLSGARWLVLVTIAAAFALAYLQAARRAPALPVTFSVIVTVLGAATLIALIYRALAGPPADGGLLDQQAGPWLGLLAGLGIAYGGFASMREESGADPAQLEIETVRLTGRT